MLEVEPRAPEMLGKSSTTFSVPRRYTLTTSSFLIVQENNNKRSPTWLNNLAKAQELDWDLCYLGPLPDHFSFLFLNPGHP